MAHKFNIQWRRQRYEQGEQHNTIIRSPVGDQYVERDENADPKQDKEKDDESPGDPMKFLVPAIFTAHRPKQGYGRDHEACIVYEADPEACLIR